MAEVIRVIHQPTKDLSGSAFIQALMDERILPDCTTEVVIMVKVGQLTTLTYRRGIVPGDRLIGRKFLPGKDCPLSRWLIESRIAPRNCTSLTITATLSDLVRITAESWSDSRLVEKGLTDALRVLEFEEVATQDADSPVLLASQEGQA